MRLQTLGLVGSITPAISDVCEVACTTFPGLCAPSIGSWCNGGGNCQHLFTEGFALCYSSEGNCSEGPPVKCSNVLVKIEEHRKDLAARRLYKHLEEELRLNPQNLRSAGNRPDMYSLDACTIC